QNWAVLLCRRECHRSRWRHRRPRLCRRSGGADLEEHRRCGGLRRQSDHPTKYQELRVKELSMNSDALKKSQTARLVMWPYVQRAVSRLVGTQFLHRSWWSNELDLERVNTRRRRRLGMDGVACEGTGEAPR